MTRMALPCLLLLASWLPGCAFHGLAKDWNGRVGPTGEPLYFASVTKIGVKLFVVIPLFGNIEIDGMVDELTDYIQDVGGDNVTIVQGSTENYWYGFSPLTWIFTPVISELSATYRPHPSGGGSRAAPATTRTTAPPSTATEPAPAETRLRNSGRGAGGAPRTPGTP